MEVIELSERNQDDGVHDKIALR